MSYSLFLGISIIALGAVSSSSFAIPFGKVKNWNWETYWMAYSLAAYIIFPLISCFLFIPSLGEVFKEISSLVLIKVFLIGMFYGIGNLAFGLTLRYLGLSLGYALSLGLMLVIGTLIPPIIDGRLSVMIGTSKGFQLFWGIGIAIIGIALVARAGSIKDKKRKESDQIDSVSEFHFTKGILTALLVGVAGSALSLGIEQGIELSNLAIEKGANPFFAVNPVLLVLLSGTLLTTIFWVGYQGIKNKTLKEYVKLDKAKILYLNYLLCTVAGFLWFIQFFLYGMGKSQMGEFTFIAWGILMALSIVFATVWGLIRGEWRGMTTKIYLLLFFALIVIITAAFIIGISASA